MFRKAARKTRTMLPEDSARKYRKIVAEHPMAAVSSRGRRPIRSESFAASGMANIDRPMATALTVRMDARSKPAVEVAYASPKTVKMVCITDMIDMPTTRSTSGAWNRSTSLRGIGVTLLLLLGLFEDRCFVQVRPDPVGDGKDHDGEPERDAPAPAHHRFLRQRGDRNEDEGGQHHAGGVARHHEAGEEAALAFGGVLQRQRGGTGRFRAGGEALGQPAGHQEDRVPRRRAARRWAGSRCQGTPGP